MAKRIRNYDATTARGLAFALLGRLDFGRDGRSMPTFGPEAIDLIQRALDKAREEGAVEAHRLWQSGALPAHTAEVAETEPHD
jgi:hypothetical protein